MDMITVLGGLDVYIVRLEDFEIDLMIGSEFLEHGIEALPRPSERLAKLMDGHPVVRGAQALVGGLELSP